MTGERRLPPNPITPMLATQIDKASGAGTAETIWQLLQEFANQAIEADRKRRGEPVAWRYLTPTGWHATTDAARALRVAEHHTVEPLFAAPQPADPTVKESLSVAEPVAWMQRSYLNQIRESNVALHNVVIRGSKLDGDGDVVPLYAAPQPAEPTTDSLPRHAAQTLADAIYKAAQKMGIANGDHSTLSVPQCLHLLDCMSQPAEPRLDSPAQVGHTRFGEGVPWSTVIGAAQRYHAAQNTPAKEQERLQRAAENIKELHQAEPVKVPSDADAKHVRDFINCDGMGAVIVEGPQYSAVVRTLLARYGNAAQPAAQVDKSEDLQGSSVDKTQEMQSQPTASAEPFGHVWRASDTTAVIKLVGDPRIIDGMPVYAAPVAEQLADGEEIIVSLPDGRRYPLPLLPTGMGAPRYRVEVPAPQPTGAAHE